MKNGDQERPNQAMRYASWSNCAIYRANSNRVEPQLRRVPACSRQFDIIELSLALRLWFKVQEDGCRDWIDDVLCTSFDPSPTVPGEEKRGGREGKREKEITFFDIGNRSDTDFSSRT